LTGNYAHPYWQWSKHFSRAVPFEQGRPAQLLLSTGGNFMAKAEIGVRPLHDRVLVRRMPEEMKTAGGIIIPETAKEKPQRGEIVATGKGRVTEDGKVTPLDVRVGDRILFGKYSGTELKLNGEEYLMMREEDILGIMN
jgi:chaperonin GroES